MADPYLIFPGTTDHVSTDDVNLLDADTAHTYQSIGTWVNANSMAPGLIDDATSFSGRALRGVVASDGANRRMATGKFAVDPSTQYSFGQSIKLEASGSSYLVRLEVEWFDGGDLSLGTVNVEVGSVPPDTYIALSGTWTSPATAATVLVRLWCRSSLLAGEALWAKDIVIREGSDASFVPSLRIVGDLFEDIEPVDMPIVYAADGTPLTVGEGWAGDGYHYRRYDGPDATAPLVAQFDAGDVPQPAQLPI